MNPLRQALKTPLKALHARRLTPVTVAVVDSGMDSGHPALRCRVGAAWRVAAGEGKPRARKLRLGRNNDAYDHGTAVGGIIAGIAPNAVLLDVGVLGDAAMGSGEVLLAGLELAIERGARLINLSLACLARYAWALHELCERAYRRGQIVVAAKRNMPLTDLGFPAELSTCVSVDATAFRSPYRLRFLEPPPIEFAARGQDVLAPAPGGGYTHKTGTSFATPTVTGLCALLLGAYPGLKPFELKTLLKFFAQARVT